MIERTDEGCRPRVDATAVGCPAGLERMRIKLRLFAGLRGLVRDNPHGEIELELPDGTTPAGLIAHLKIDPRMAQVMLIDGRQATDPAQALPDGAAVDILPPVAGG